MSDCRLLQEQQADDANTVNFLEQKLRQQDAVMEPDVWNTLKRYVNPATGGNPQTAVELLSEHYVGTGHKQLDLPLRLCTWALLASFLLKQIELQVIPSCRLRTHGWSGCVLDQPA